MPLNWDKLSTDLGFESPTTTGIDYNKIQARLNERRQQAQPIQPVTPKPVVPRQQISPFADPQAGVFAQQAESVRKATEYRREQDELQAKQREQQLQQSRMLQGEELQKSLPSITKLRPETVQAIEAIPKDETKAYLRDQVNEIKSLVENNKAKELEEKYGYDIRDLYDNENFNKALQLASREWSGNIRRFNIVKKTEGRTAAGRFLSRLGQAGTQLLLGERVPEELRPATGVRAADITADIVGGAAALSAPVPGLDSSILRQGVRAGEVVGERAARLGGRAGRALGTDLGQRLVRGATAGAIIDLQQGVKEGDSPEQLGKRLAIGAALGGIIDLGLYGVEKGVATFAASRVPTQEVLDEAIDAANIDEVAKEQVRQISGKYTVKNTKLVEAVEARNEAIQDIQNHFKHWKLTPEEVARIKPELGIDIEQLNKAVLDAQDITLRDVLTKADETARLAEVAGVQERARPATLLGDQAPVIDDVIPPRIEEPTVPRVEEPVTPRVEEPVLEEPFVPRLVPDEPVLGGIEDTVTPRQLDLLPEEVPTQQTELDSVLRQPGEEVSFLPEETPIEQRLARATEEAELRTGEEPRVRRFQETARRSPTTTDELENMIRQDPAYYNPISNAEQIKVADEIIAESPDVAKNLVLEGNSFKSNIEPVIGQRMYSRLQQEGNFEEAFRLLDSMNRKYTDAGRQVQTATLMSKTTPEGMVNFIRKMITQANENLPAGKQIDFTPTDAAAIADRMTLISQLQNETERATATAALQQEYANLIPAKIGDKISTIQAIAHLGNFKTFARNIVANTGFGGVEQIAKVVSTPIDKVVSATTGRRAVTLPSLTTESLRAGVQRGKRSAREIIQGIDTLGGGRYDITGQTFTKGPLAVAEKGLSLSLKAPDEFFKGIYEDQVAKELMSLYGLSEPTEEILEIAAKEAQYATFQDNSLPAQFLSKTKEALNTLGLKSYGLGDFGAGDLIIKYTRVPGNIISRGVEYSPLGLIKVILGSKNVGTSIAAQRNFSLGIGRSITGTGIIGLGAFLHQKGILNIPHKKGDIDAAALERGEGKGKYSINTSALVRLAKGGNPEPMKGDKLETYNWLQPLSTGLAVGAAVGEELKNDGTVASVSRNALERSFDEFIDLPTMYTVKSMFFEGLKQDSGMLDVAAVPFKQAVPGFIPSPVRQIAQAADPYARRIEDEGPLGRTGQQLKANIPGLRQQLPERLDPLGQPIKQETGFLPAFKPSIGSELDPYPFSDQLRQLEEVTGKTSQYPQSRAPKSFSHNKKKYELNTEQQNEFLRISGDIINREYTKILEGKDIIKLTEREHTLILARLKKVRDNARTTAKNRLLRQMKTRRTDE